MNASDQNPSPRRVPFKFKGPLDPREDERIWVERSRNWDRILTHLRRKEWIALLGPKGSGKTSSLIWIAQQCGDAGFAAAPFLLDMAQLQESDPVRSIREFVSLFRRGGRGRPEDLSLDWNRVEGFVNLSVDSVESPADLAEFVVELAERCHGKLLVMLDDADLASPDGREAVFRSLRAVHESLRDPKLWIQLVVCGSDAEAWLGLPTETDSPLANVLARVYLESFDDRQIHSLIKAAFEEHEPPPEIEKSAVEVICQLTKCIPVNVQFLLYHVYVHAISYSRDLITSDMVRNVAAQIGFKSKLTVPDTVGQINERLGKIETHLAQLAEAVRSLAVRVPPRDELPGQSAESDS